jgi:hypothetical protein
MKAADIQRDLKARSSTDVLKPKDAAKADVCTKFSLVFSRETSQNDETMIHVQYLCVCSKCFTVYRYKASDDSSYGIKFC